MAATPFCRIESLIGVGLLFEMMSACGGRDHRSMPVEDGRLPRLHMEAKQIGPGRFETLNGDPSMVDGRGPFLPAQHPAFPQLVGSFYHVIANPRLVTIAASNDLLAPSLFNFTDQLVAGPWWPAAASEYGIGRPTGSIHALGPPIYANPTEGDMKSYIQDLITRDPELAPDGSTIYMFYLPDGIVAMEDKVYPAAPNTNCRFYAGYHERITAAGDNWALAQRCFVATSSTDQLDTLTVTASHEIIEAATDPGLDGYRLPMTSTRAPWVDSVWAHYYGGPVESGDLCQYTQVRIDGYLHQRNWSNQAARAGGDPCAPAIKEPYYSTSVPKDWYPLAQGETVHVPITGWSTARTKNDWIISATPTFGYNDFQVSLTSSTSTNTLSGTFPTLNNGRVATLTVRASDRAPSGLAYVVVAIVSSPVEVASDALHFWPVGFYVP
jgi:hypothetical protein